jgi:hypothetical protein
VHGVVAETWGAVVLQAQAEGAISPRLRRFYARVARDEARHSALASAVDRWATRRLDARARARLHAAEAAALASIEREVSHDGPRTVADLESGRPREQALVALWATARGALWGGTVAPTA